MVFIYWLIFLLIFLSIGIGLFIYAKKKKSKIVLSISAIMIVIIILSLLSNTIDEFTISKNDVISDLKYIDITLNDDFEITNNKVTGMPERIQETEIQITQKDMVRIINGIKTSANFKEKTNEQYPACDGVILNFKHPEFYSREKFSIIDNVPTRLILSIYFNNNTIEYQRIED